jgi:3-dehydroquinate synthetase
METLRVALGERSYPIHIGAGILDAPELYRPHLGSGRVAVISNPVVAPLYLPGRVRGAAPRRRAAPLGSRRGRRAGEELELAGARV